MTEADKKLVIRNATMEDLFAVAEVEAECFPVSEAATEAEFRERIACYGGHFWLLFEDERLVSFVDGMVTDQEDLTDEMYERAELHQEVGEWQMIFGVNTIPSCRHQGYAAAGDRGCEETGTQRACTDLQGCTHSLLCEVWICK